MLCCKVLVVLVNLCQVLALDIVANSSSSSPCKVTPSDEEWPSDSDWAKLNQTIQGALIQTSPAALQCYSNSSESGLSCSYVEENWGYSAFHAAVPESIDYPIWANNSCLPPNATGYTENAGCQVGGYPSYIVNATTNQQIATALEWAAARNIRVVVKNTGHDLNGR